MENAIQTRFESKYEVDPVTFCWMWTAGTDNGYGRFSVEGKMVQAHRWAFEWFVGPLPEWEPGDPNRMEMHHVCGKRACVNPGHLKLVSRGEHMATDAPLKLTKDEVLEIRARSAFGDSGVELAARYGVSGPTISQIVLRKTWKHI